MHDLSVDYTTALRYSYTFTETRCRASRCIMLAATYLTMHVVYDNNYTITRRKNQIACATSSGGNEHRLVVDSYVTTSCSFPRDWRTDVWNSFPANMRLTDSHAACRRALKTPFSLILPSSSLLLVYSMDVLYSTVALFLSMTGHYYFYYVCIFQFNNNNNNNKHICHKVVTSEALGQAVCD